MTNRMNVLITDPLEKEGADIFRNAGFNVDEVGKMSPQELALIIEKYDAVVVRSGTKITGDVIAMGKRLKIIGRAGVGLDNIDIETATRSGVIVMNAPEGNTVSAAEHTVAMMMALARKLPAADRSMKAGEWEKKKFTGCEFHGKTIGIIGLGRIGRRVASVAGSLGMKVLGYDPYLERTGLHETNITVVNLPGLLREADFITLHVPLTENTHHLIGEKELAGMKKGVYIINCSRGGIIDEDALYRQITAGRVRGAALDVFEKEPPGNIPLLKLEEVIATPHLGASTKEAQINVAQQLAKQIVEALENNVVVNAVNFPSPDAKSMDKLNGYLSLGKKIGMLLKQLAEGEAKEINITYSGDIINYDLSLLKASVIVGLFNSRTEKVNPVNAPLVLKQKGIKLTEFRVEKGSEFSELVKVAIKNCKTVSAAGTIIREGGERIVKINDFSVEAVPKGYLLICSNEDAPGIMGHIGTVLGQNGVNIASMTLGRKKRRGPAITVLNLDQGIDATLVNKIEEFPVIHSVKLVRI